MSSGRRRRPAATTTTTTTTEPTTTTVVAAPAEADLPAGWVAAEARAAARLARVAARFGALDDRLAREVVARVTPPDLAGDPGRQMADRPVLERADAHGALHRSIGVVGRCGGGLCR